MTSDNFASLGRRQFLGIAAAATAATVATPSRGLEKKKASSAYAAPTGMVTASLGEYEITSLLDGIIPMQKGYFSGDQKAIDQVLENVGLGDGNMPAPVSAFLLRSKGKTILIDTGMGAIDMLGPGYGQMIHALMAKGVSPDRVDTVIITHAHPDHVGGLLTADGQAVFPNAEIMISEVEAGFWTNAEHMEKAPDGAKGIFQFAQAFTKAYGDQITQVADGKELAKGLTLQSAHGHTPGHSVVQIDGGARQMIMVADLFHSADLHPALPDTGFGFDIDSKQAAETRKKLFDQLASDKTLIAATHAHFPGFGRIIKDGDAYRYLSVSL